MLQSRIKDELYTREARKPSDEKTPGKFVLPIIIFIAVRRCLGRGK